MRRLLTALTLSVALLNMGGCVLAVGNDGSDDSSWNSSDYRDSDLAHTVRKSLEGDALTHDADITVSADRGRVFLSGTVNGPDVLSRAVQLAFALPDVKSVRCHVTVIR